ncbi:MAG: sulfurtransferase TusA family protein [Chloroflexi bacterium]|jgi:tRNA 2-thiouridine synthesizing protein A|nr:sulfurtransferase TusA family protein [Chloroflexota bacterium]
MTLGTPDITLDLEGMLCPIPIVKVAKALKTMDVGSVLQATASDPGVLIDIPAWARTTGNELLSIEREDKIITFQVRKLS